MAPLPTLSEIVHSGPFPLILLVCNLLAAFACGTYSLYLYMTHTFPTSQGPRLYIVLAYLLAFSVVIPAAELGFMRHPYLSRFARFLLAPLGRAVLYMFMGGVLLGNGLGGWIVGVYVLVAGLMNVLALCYLG